jgi:DNA-binding transcriptional regulator YhcF (GntR family)
MNFIDNQAIYLQIADKVCENILTQKWVNGERIPPVREIAVSMEVNPNTANRAYDFLQSFGIIFNKRGIGYFVSDDGYEKAVEYRKKQFIEEEVPQFLKTMKLVGVTCAELENYYQTLK